ESRRKIFEVYLGGETGDILAKDVDIEALVQETEGYVGADIEALVREAKMAAMRDFIVLMGISTEQERKDAIRNVMVTRAHFEAALVKVRGSLDRDALQKSEIQAWEMLYNQDQRTILTRALTVVNRAAASSKKIDETLVNDLRKAVFQRKKDFTEITKRTDILEKKMDRK
ncbi:MAG TPA: AAA family ATPase, partial [Methanoregula sp.]|nr:AAA family ATPase [Methanoregula sp.]